MYWRGSTERSACPGISSGGEVISNYNFILYVFIISFTSLLFAFAISRRIDLAVLSFNSVWNGNVVIIPLSLWRYLWWLPVWWSKTNHSFLINATSKLYLSGMFFYHRRIKHLQNTLVLCFAFWWKFVKGTFCSFLNVFFEIIYGISYCIYYMFAQLYSCSIWRIFFLIYRNIHDNI